MTQQPPTILGHQSSPPPPQRAAVGKHTLRGTVLVFLAEALILPTGLITAAFLTRKLDNSGYGLFTLASTVVTWLEWSLVSIFARAVIKFTAEAGDDWRPVGKTVVRLHLWLSCLVALALVLFAGPIAAALREPALAGYLRLFAIEIPIFSLGQAHRNLLIGLGGFGRRALGGAVRWVARLIFMVVLIEMGLSIEGAILGNILATVVETIIYRWFTPVSVFGSSAFPVSQLWGYAVPLFLASISMRLFERLDLVMLKRLGGTAADAGIYGAAQNLSIIPGILAMSFAPLLLSTLSRVLRGGDRAHAQDIARDSVRLALLTVPGAGIVAGASHEIVVLIFGAHFRPAADPLSLLMFGGVALLVLNVTTSVMLAAGKPAWTFAFTGPLVVAAAAGNYLFIPQYRMTGAAASTASVACAGALASVVGVYALWGVVPRLGTWIRVGVVTFGAYALAASWHTPGPMVAVKLIVAMVGVGVAYLVLGEFDRREIEMVRSVAQSLTFRKGEGAR